jgi:hypothetical protein
MRLPLCLPRRRPPQRAPDEGQAETFAGEASGPAWLLALLRQAALDQHGDWRAECVEVALTFEAWSRAAGPRERPFASYCAALEREERASEIYRDLLAEVGCHCP